MQISMRFVRKNLFEILKGKEKNILLCTVSTVLTTRLTVIDRFHLHFIFVVRFIREINYCSSSFYLGATVCGFRVLRVLNAVAEMLINETTGQ